MLVVIWVLNNITAHRLFTTCHGVLIDSYQYQTVNNFEKLLDLEDIENTLMITAPIFLVLYIYIRSIRFLENGAPNTKFYVDRRLCTRFTNLD